MPEALGWRIRTWNESLLTSWSGWTGARLLGRPGGHTAEVEDY